MFLGALGRGGGRVAYNLDSREPHRKQRVWGSIRFGERGGQVMSPNDETFPRDKSCFVLPYCRCTFLLKPFISHILSGSDICYIY